MKFEKLIPKDDGDMWIYIIDEIECECEDKDFNSIFIQLVQSLRFKYAILVQTCPLFRERPGVTRSQQVAINFRAVYPKIPRKSGFVIGDLAPCHQKLFRDEFEITFDESLPAFATPEIFHTSICNVAKLMAKGEQIWIRRGAGNPWRKIQFTFLFPLHPAVQRIRGNKSTTDLRALQEFFTKKVLTYLQSGMENNIMKTDSTVFFNLVSDLLELLLVSEKPNDDQKKTIRRE
jgi:hypothetical protein